MRAWIVVVLLGSPVFAETPKKDVPKLSAADQKKYKDALKKGRGLEGQKKYAEAVTAFEECTKISPDDAVCLSELGWAAFEAKDLKKAEAATRKSLANQAAPNVRGAALYNLGRILEDKKDKPGAITAYSESLRARPHPVVRARLKTLDEKVAAMFDPFAPQKLEGPFPSIEAYCKTQPAKEDLEPGAYLECRCGEKLEAPAMKLAAPFEKVEMFSRTCQAMAFGTTYYHLGVKTAKGWFVKPTSDYSFNRHCDNGVKIKDVKVTDVASAPGAEALVTYTSAGSCSGNAAMDDWDDEYLVVVGAGAAGFAGTPPVLVKKLEHHQDDPFEDKPGPTKTVTDINFTLVWNKDGSLEVKGKATGLDKTEAANLLGKHALAFP